MQVGTDSFDAALRARRVRGFALLLATAALCVGVVSPGTAVAADTGGASAGKSLRHSRDSVLQRGDRGRAVKALQRKLGVTADGVFGRLTERAVKRFQRRRGLTPDGIVGPATRRALGLRAIRTSGGSRVRLPRVLRRIAKCESGGNPAAVSPDGRYRGKYQFSRATWRSIGGKGDPAKAPESVQDRMALRLYRQRGTAPWPNCA